MVAQTAQLKLAVAKRKSKGPIMVDAHHEAKVLKKIKTSTNANLNKTLRAPKPTQEAAQETNSITQFALANMEMMHFNQRSQSDRETIASVNDYVNTNFNVLPFLINKFFTKIASQFLSF